MQFVRLVNKDKRPFDFHQSNQKRVLKPGAEVMVPWDVATSLFGDPASVDTTTDQARTRALKQSRGQYGYVLGGMTTEEWEDLRPKVEVYDVESGDRIYMVLEDPDGTRYGGTTPALSADSLTSRALEDQVATLTKQLETMMQILTQQQANTPPDGQSALASRDAPDDDGTGPTGLPEATAGEDTPQTPPVGPKPHLAPRKGAVHVKDD
jgi:hypothetical protein